jgi:redox-sensitive bicupin YhaK (pirin superfamily)
MKVIWLQGIIGIEPATSVNIFHSLLFYLRTCKTHSMKSEIYPSENRGHANHGWLDTYHTFSFAGYYNPERIHFGALRVLNDDRVAPGRGFGMHPHDNMEIISIPLEGDLEHRDSMKNRAVIREGDLQVMSAGTGVFHSEYNLNPDREVKFLQIWVFPNRKNVEPRYDQISMKDLERPNEFYQVLSPDREDQGVWIHQDAWFHMGRFDQDHKETYQLKKAGNGIFLLVIDGQIETAGHMLKKRDGLGIWDTDSISFRAVIPSRLLLMEVPMKINQESFDPE